jgi:hypothetical protein
MECGYRIVFPVTNSNDHIPFRAFRDFRGEILPRRGNMNSDWHLGAKDPDPAGWLIFLAYPLVAVL